MFVLLARDLFVFYDSLVLFLEPLYLPPPLSILLEKFLLLLLSFPFVVVVEFPIHLSPSLLLLLLPPRGLHPWSQSQPKFRLKYERDHFPLSHPFSTFLSLSLSSLSPALSLSLLLFLLKRNHVRDLFFITGFFKIYVC